MQEELWTWADLDDPKLAALTEAERTLGADYVLVYRRGEPNRDLPASVALPPAVLDESQLDCLRGLERVVGGVAVAYRRAA